MSESNQLTEFYDGRYAEGYMEDWPERKKQRVEQLIGGLGLGPRGRALDFGCGQGVFTEVLRRVLPAWEIHGTELSDVALAMARRRVPQCQFHRTTDLHDLGRFDFIFSHHVLEHVLNLESVVAELSRAAAPQALMMHILPCGNAGSLEHRIATLHRNGIDRSAHDRFFFDDEGHVRRLTSPQLVDAAARHDWQIRTERFANHYWGAIEWITGLDLSFIGVLTDHAQAVDRRARAELLLWRLALAGLYVGRRARILPVDAMLRTAADREWVRCRHEPGGSEMYMVFHRGPTGFSSTAQR